MSFHASESLSAVIEGLKLLITEADKETKQLQVTVAVLVKKWM